MLTETVRQNEITEITVPSQFDILLLSPYTHSCLCPIESFEYSLHSESVKRIYSQVFIYSVSVKAVLFSFDIARI